MDDWGQLVASSSQLGGVFQSGPVWSGPSGYWTVLAARVGRWGRVQPRLNQDLGKHLGVDFRWRKLAREQLGGYGPVMGSYRRKGARGQVAPFRPIPCNRSPSSYRENSAQIVREKPRERDQRLKEKPCVKACSVLAKAWLWKTRLVEMDTRQKEKEKEKKVAQGDRTPKVLTWTVVKERHREDSSHGKMCGE
ncbi:hypothetical protein F2Q69_00022803 [Brassica cretica]|uniref:Uncharacterized protein n=1 Tax=Brassica cretica TaxID=69181 RepID=A0A8S9QDX8_BRACR|nr:hypothetical protein F2Q69_00022803 [Brassica cretica]